MKSSSQAFLPMVEKGPKSGRRKPEESVAASPGGARRRKVSAAQTPTAGAIARDHATTGFSARCGKFAARAVVRLQGIARRICVAASQRFAAMKDRALRKPGGGRPITVVDQASAGAKLRLVLVEVDGQRVLLAASGDQVPAMLALGMAQPAARRGRRKTVRSNSADRGSGTNRNTPLAWEAGNGVLPPGSRGRLAGWDAGTAAGGEIQ